MKKLILLLIGAVMVCAVQAQMVEEGEAALVYYAPKTAVALDFTYTVETQVRGQFAQFAESLLGATDVVTENSSSYTLDEVRISTSTSADQSRPHKITVDGGIPMLFTINDKGLLTGYNISPESQADRRVRHESSTRPAVKSRISPKRIAPYPEEVLKAGGPASQARETAKQILHIRETRMYLLSGEVERAPADGKAMELVLEELDRQEEALTELFIGKRTKKTEHKKVTLNSIHRNGSQDREIYKEYLYFSGENGFTSKENVDADSILVWIGCHKAHYKASEIDAKKSKKRGDEASQVIYNLPGDAVVRVIYQGRLLGERTIPVAQKGIDVPLPKSLFTGSELPKIVFSEKTGNVISISK